MLNLAWRDSTPKTIPIANALIAMGMVRRAPRIAPERVNVTFSLAALLLSLTFALCTLLNPRCCYLVSMITSAENASSQQCYHRHAEEFFSQRVMFLTANIFGNSLTNKRILTIKTI